MLQSVLLLALAAVACANPLGVRDEEYEWVYSGKFEGDMILNEDQLSNLQARNGIIGDNYRWPNKTVVYEISSDLSATERDAILAVFKHYENRTCIRFRERDASDVGYVYVTADDKGCFSDVGHTGRQQRLNLAHKGCFYKGTIIHEFLHTLGFHHQQSAIERDKYVTIVKDNINKTYIDNFDIYNSDNFDVPYDYGSIMHYPANAFSINGQPTIIPKDINATIGQRRDLSNRDIQKLHRMYGCA